MEINIRQEVASDRASVEAVIENAFRNIAHSDQSEYLLVCRLRSSEAFIPELSLVAVVDGEIAGHIMHTKVKVGDNELLALAPLAVAPKLHGNGIGKRLVETSHAIACELGYKGIVVLGDPTYYSLFGYKPASNWHITCPFEVPSEYFMAIELSEKALDQVSGTVTYSNAFFG